MDKEDLLNEENQEMILELTPAARSFLEAENSVTCLNALSEDGTLPNLFLRKLGLQQFLELSNPLLQTSDTSPKSGKEIVPTNDFLDLCQTKWYCFSAC